MSHDAYDIPALDAALAGTPFAGHLRYFDTTQSTNLLAVAAAQAGAEAGAVYLADAQTAGRGRGGHQWLSPDGVGLYVSVLLRPRMAASRALMLSLATGLAAQKAVREAAGYEIDIRWPNDLMTAASPQKKCGGILVETAVKPSGHLHYAVIGVGINVRQREMPEEIRGVSTSLAIETGKEISRQAVLSALLCAVHAEVDALESAESTMPLLERFAAASTWVRGKRVHVSEGGGYTGITAGLDAQGMLLVETADGLRTVLSGGVREL